MATVPSVASSPTETTRSRSPSTSTSLANTLSVVRPASSAKVNVSSSATGASLTGFTRTVTVAVSAPPLPSTTSYWKLSVPLKSWVGVYVTVPSSFTVAVPFAGPVTMRPTDRLSPSTSVSLASTSITTGTSSSVVAVSSPATGASLTDVTSMKTRAEEKALLPSVIV